MNTLGYNVLVDQPCEGGLMCCITLLWTQRSQDASLLCTTRSAAPNNPHNGQITADLGDIGLTRTPEDALKQGEMLTKSLDCGDSDNILNCLQNKNVNDFVYENVTAQGAAIWNAVPDKEFSSDPYLPAKVIDLLQNGQFNRDIEVIIGANADEGILLTAPATNGLTEWDEFRDNFHIDGTKLLFGIANESAITLDDLIKMQKLVQYYVGGIENISSRLGCR